MSSALLGQALAAPKRVLIVAGLDDARTASSLTDSLIATDNTAANTRLQLRSGDNQAMQTVLDAAAEVQRTSPLPDGIDTSWAGESYLNLVWQDKMVAGMIVGLLTTLAVIVILLALLFRSVGWALLGIAPVLWTIAVVYGVIGLLGKGFDMPIAVLSTMVLGIGVDFAIHFLQRFRCQQQSPRYPTANARRTDRSTSEAEWRIAPH